MTSPSVPGSPALWQPLGPLFGIPGALPPLSPAPAPRPTSALASALRHGRRDARQTGTALSQGCSSGKGPARAGWRASTWALCASSFCSEFAGILQAPLRVRSSAMCMLLASVCAESLRSCVARPLSFCDHSPSAVRRERCRDAPRSHRPWWHLSGCDPLRAGLHRPCRSCPRASCGGVSVSRAGRAYRIRVGV